MKFLLLLKTVSGLIKNCIQKKYIKLNNIYTIKEG